MTQRDYTQDLNEFFYRARPHEYFHHRLFNLVLLLTKKEEVTELAADGLNYGFVTIEAGLGEDGQREPSPLWVFATCESQVLVHHIAEVLLRLFLAHQGGPRCPVLELSSLRLPKDFKTALKRFLDASEDSRRVALMEVFWGGSDVAHLSREHPEPDWESGAAAIERLLVHGAHRLLNEAPLYNAAKHGLAVATGRSALTVDIEGVDLGMSTVGLNVEYLERLQRDEDGERWRHTTRWIDEKTDIAVCYLWTHLIDSLWSVATNRYLGVEGYSIYCVPDHAVKRLLEKRQQPLTAMGRTFVFKHAVASGAS